ncbi:uncharacterized protein N0V89_006691 [Didymosphaeria variabile]|uniref:Uncharacterized protein n=1 Tax=Didymosphaeria variabile TaxID=1932322 RepID=A0A9W8XJH1_9PLEO|nr:uncharacterized protein N0V89_006691 [Didymosphaeria variabile]KAJ4351351.1 hypothetical protein N0V89_006691 [Didymosphaeria variabile]
MGSLLLQDNRTSQAAYQDYQLQLMLLEQHSKRRLLMAKQEQDRIEENNSPLQAYQNRLISLEQENKERRTKGKGNFQESSQGLHIPDQQMQHLLLEQENKRRILQAHKKQEEQKKADGLENYVEALKIEEQQITKRRSFTGEEQKGPIQPANVALHTHVTDFRAFKNQKKVCLLKSEEHYAFWQNTQPFAEPPGVPIKLESQQPQELHTQGHPAMAREEQNNPARMALGQNEMQLRRMVEADKQRVLRAKQEQANNHTSTEPAWKRGNLQSNSVTANGEPRMEWEEIFPGDIDSPPGTPRMTPPESPLPTLAECFPDYNWARMVGL